MPRFQSITKQGQAASKRRVVCCAWVGLLLVTIVGFGLLQAVDQAFAAPAPQVNPSPQVSTFPASAVAQPGYVILRGNTRPEANPRNDRGRVADEMTLNHMMLLLQRTPEQEQALEQFIADLHDPASPLFHHWITAEEYGITYGAAPGDVARVTNWLESQGFAVNLVYPNQMVIDFTGTAGQVRNAFRTEIHHLMVNGHPHIANMSDPQIPASLTSVVAGIVSLNDFWPRPTFVPRPQYTISSTEYAIVPGDLWTIYNFTPAFTAGYSGQNQTIVLLEDTNLYSTSDWNNFRSAFGLNTAYASGNLTQVNPAPATGTNNCTNPGTNPDDIEAAVDVEWASAAAPNATIELASCANTETTFGLYTALQNLLTESSPPPIVSISYGASEALLGATYNTAVNSVFQQAVTAGVSVFVSAGDSGADTSDQGYDYASSGINISGFTSTPYNVSVGGTDFADTYENTNTTYWNSTNSTSTSTGMNYSSAKSYIPEIPWNSSCGSQLIADYLKFSTTYGASGLCNSTSYASLFDISAGSGGPSGCATGAPDLLGVVSGTCAGYPKPYWQSGLLGNPNDNVRDVPDVALAAGGIWGHFYVLCFTDTTNGGTANCTGAPSTWNGGGGTSVAAPIWAGLQALANQATGSRWGDPTPAYYALAAAEYGASGTTTCNTTAALKGTLASNCVFYDVTQIPMIYVSTGSSGGDNDIPCWGMNCYSTAPGNDTIAGVLSSAPESMNEAIVTYLGTTTSGGTPGWTTAPTCTVSGGVQVAGGTAASCSASISGVVANVNLTSGGSGYYVPTASNPTPITCTISAPASGEDASCEVTYLSASTGAAVTGIALTAYGSGYTSAPTCTIAQGSNTTATCTATYDSSGITVTLTSGGSGYTSLPHCALSGGAGGSGETCALLAINSSGSYEPAFTAGTGWDFATGIGSVNASNLVNSLIGTGGSTSPTSLSFSTAPNTTSAAQTVTVTNTGTNSLAVGTVTLTGTNASDFTKSADTCSSATVATGKTCTVSVTFSPSAVGTYTASLNIFYAAPNGSQTVTLTGTTATNVTLSPSSLTFSAENVGTTSAAQTLTLSNPTTSALTIASIAIGGTNPSDFAIASTGTTCLTSSPVAAAGSCTISVTFTPASAATFNATLTVTDNAGGVTGSTQSSSLTGTGTVAVSLSPSSLTFSAQAVGTTSAAQTLTLSNPTTSALTIASLAIGGTNPSDFAIASTGTTCSTSSPVAAAGSCTISVTFTPASAATFNATLTVTDNAGGVTGSTQSATLTGTGTAGVSLSPSSLTFSAQMVGTTSAAQTLTLSNPTTSALTIASLAIGGTNPSDFAIASTGTTCSTSSPVAAAGSCTISVTFTPAATGTFSATLTVTDNANGVSGSTQTASLTGTGAVPVASVSTSSLTFTGQLLNTASAAQTVTVNNTGGIGLTITSIAITASAPFAVATTGTTCSTTSPVAASGSCTINVTFTPTATGAAAGTLTITDNNNGTAGSTQTVSLSGTGLDFSVTVPSGSPTSQTVAPGGTATYTLAVTGTGAASQAVTFACTGTLPAGVTCSFSPSSVTPSSTAQTVTLTVTTTNPPSSMMGPRIAPRTLPPLPAPLPLLMLWVFLLGVAWMAWAWRRFGPSRWRTVFLPLAAGLLLILAIAACGGGGSSSPPPPAQEPVVNLSASTLTFSAQSQGTTSAAQTVTLNNTGNAALSVASVAVTGTNAGDFAQTNTCGSSVAASGSCTISVTFTPTATGSRTGSVTITDNNNGTSGSTQTVSLTGTGATPAGTYTLTVTATTGSGAAVDSHSMTLTLIVS